MKTNVQITAVQKEFKNGQNGYEVKVEGMDGKLNCKMNFYEPLKAMRYMFMLSKRLELQIDSVQLAALSLAYQRAKEAEQKAVEDAMAVAGEFTEAEPVQEGQAPEVESIAMENSSSSLPEQFKSLKEKHPDAVLLFRCGDFYEAYCEDAKAVSNILGITLTKRSSDGAEMAGFPYHALDTYLPRLIRNGLRVAICDNLEAPEVQEPKRRGRKPAVK